VSVALADLCPATESASAWRAAQLRSSYASDRVHGWSLGSCCCGPRARSKLLVTGVASRVRRRRMPCSTCQGCLSGARQE